MSEYTWWDETIEKSGDDWWNTVSDVHREAWWEWERSGSTWWQLGGKEDEYVEGEWVRGIRRTLPIEWYEIIDWIPVDPEKEIVDIVIEPETLNHPDGCHFDAFSLRRSMLLEKLYGPEEEQVHMRPVEAESLPHEFPLFGAPMDRRIMAVYILPEDNTAATGDDRVTLSVYNHGTGGVVCTATIMEGDNLSAYSLRQFGGISPTHGNMAAGTGLSMQLAVTQGSGFAIPRSRIVILWDIADFEEAE